MARRVRKKRRKNIKRGYGVLLGIILGAGSVVSLTVIGMMVFYMLLGLPEISGLASYNPPMVTTVLDSDGNVLAYWYKEKRWPVPMSEIPEQLVQAFLAAEDARFYEHRGIDFIGVLRAVLKNVEAREIVQGASTITQQVTRSLLLSRERTWIRKVKEAILAWQIDATLTKDEILIIYLNQIYLGQGAYGVEAAARTYFSKHVRELSLAECALLAGLPQAPSRYNPARHMEKAVKRQHYVLRRMMEEGYITRDDMEDAMQSGVEIRQEAISLPPGADFFLSEVRKELERRYGRNRLLTAGMTVVTTLKSDWQKRADQVVRNGMRALVRRHPDDQDLSTFLQAALLSVDAATGSVRAMWGGSDFKKSQFNLATQAMMQPGSAFKPVVYAAALAEGVVRPNTVIIDEPVSLPGAEPGNPWEPENFDKTYMGPVTVRTGITYSRNIISVKLAKMVGLDSIRSLARKMGIEVTLAENLSIALGSSAVPLIQMVRAYTVFPNLGMSMKPQFVEEVRDRKGRVLEHLEPVSQEVIDTLTAFQMLHLLRGVVENGTGRCARSLGIPAAGKTGTTDDCRDAWFMGFTPEIVTGVWVGRQDKKTLGQKETGGRVACPIWTSFMSVVVREAKKKLFDLPEGVALTPVDIDTGEIVIPEQSRGKSVIWEAMREDSLPALDPSPVLSNRPYWLRRLNNFLFNRGL